MNAIAQALGEEKWVALPVFTFSLLWHIVVIPGREKRTAWNAWLCFPEITNTFRTMTECRYTLLVTEVDHFEMSRALYIWKKNLTRLSLSSKPVNNRNKARATFHRHKMPGCSMWIMQPVKRVSGPHLTRHCLQHLCQNTGGWTKDGSSWVPLHVALNWVLANICFGREHCSALNWVVKMFYNFYNMTSNKNMNILIPDTFLTLEVEHPIKWRISEQTSANFQFRTKCSRTFN